MKTFRANLDSGNEKLFIALLLISAILLSIAVTSAQVDALGIHFIRVQQEKVHLQMLQGTAGNPWQYRILADLLVEPVIKLSSRLGIPQPDSFSFIAFRFLQNLFILIVAGIYYRKLGLQLPAILVGLSVLAWSMSNSLYNSDLSFNVFFDVAFYMLAAILMLAEKFGWVVLLMILAAFNRETSILIPFTLVCLFRFDKARKGSFKSAAIAAAIGLIIYAIIFVGLRVYYGPQQFLTADGYYPGLGLLLLNLRRWVTWQQLLVTLGIVPLLAILAYRNWPPTLRIFFWTIVPVWVGVHFVAALVAETRLMLVPQALIFIPGALLGIRASGERAAQPSQATVA